MVWALATALLLVSKTVLSAKPQEPYYGCLIGPFQDYAHGIRGTIYAVDDSTIFIKGFSYDGTGPDAFFWIGNSPRPSPEGIIIPYPEDYAGREPPVLRAYNNTDIILRLPMGKRIRDIRWLSVWCRRFTVDFGEVFIPPDLEIPRPRVLPEFRRLAHGLRSDNISILDARTFYIPNLHYDGAGPDAYFWVGNGTEPNRHGIKVPNEMGSLEPLRGYQGEDIEIQLPGALTVYDIDWLAVWCVQYQHNFGHVIVPRDLGVPPALGQTKISPAWWYNPTSAPPKSPSARTNCRQFLDKRLQVRWEKMGDLVQIALSGKIGEDQYMAFGLSGSTVESRMIGGDVTVAFYDRTARSFKAVDYYLSQYAQCDGKSGVCPDERLGGRNDATLINGDRKNGVTTVTFTRPFHTNEAINDRPIPREGEVAVIAAIGPLNSAREANSHLADKTVDTYKIDFGSNDDNDCSVNLDDLYGGDNGITPWTPARISGESSFTARIGPTGGRRGYTPTTGQPSWGIAWYINDLLIPEITVERNQTYTFVVEGGNDPSNPASYHPFYITDSKDGGYGQKNDVNSERVYAGVEYTDKDYPKPTVAGRSCIWGIKGIDQSDNITTFEQYFKTLELQCDPGEPAYLNWTVPWEAPSVLYYQCYIHRNLGWKIHVVDPGQSSERNGDTRHKASGAGVSTMSLVAAGGISLLTLSALTIHARGRIL